MKIYVIVFEILNNNTDIVSNLDIILHTIVDLIFLKLAGIITLTSIKVDLFCLIFRKKKYHLVIKKYILDNYTFAIVNIKIKIFVLKV